MISQILGSTNTSLGNGFYSIKLVQGMNLESCLSICLKNSFNFAGLSQLVLNNLFSSLQFVKTNVFQFWRGTTCQCGNTLKLGTASSSLCTTKCIGNNNQLCGASNNFNVYTTKSKMFMHLNVKSLDKVNLIFQKMIIPITLYVFQ